MEIKEQILLGAAELYKRYGIKSITMDDIARHVAASKKTIYQFYADKDALVLAVVEHEMQDQKCEVEDIFQNSADVIEEMLKMGEFMRKRVSHLNPSLLFDMKKFHPIAWKAFQGHKRQYMAESIRRSIERGMQEGYFRDNLQVDVMAMLRVEEVEMCFNPDVFPPDKYDFRDTHMQLFLHFMYGISTVKGHERIDEIQKQLNQIYTNTST
jgi:AcrR family transcriptional regulator